MERDKQKPTYKEIFYALASEDTYPDWDAEIIDRADPLDVKRVNSILIRGLPLSEAEIEIRGLKNERR